MSNRGNKDPEQERSLGFQRNEWSQCGCSVASRGERDKGEAGKMGRDQTLLKTVAFNLSAIRECTAAEAGQIGTNVSEQQEHDG